MFVKLDSIGEIRDINLNNVNRFYIERVFFNCTDDKSKSGFKYSLIMETKNDKDKAMLYTYNTKEEAEEGLDKIATKINALSV